MPASTQADSICMRILATLTAVVATGVLLTGCTDESDYDSPIMTPTETVTETTTITPEPSVSVSVKPSISVKPSVSVSVAPDENENDVPGDGGR